MGQERSPFVCFAGLDWWYHHRAHSDFQLMLRLAEEHEVLLINSIGMRMPVPGRTTRFAHRLLRKLRSMLKFLRTPEPNLPRFHVLTPIVLPFYGSRRLRKLNYWLVGIQVRAAMRWLGIRNPHVVVTLPTAFEVAKRIPHKSLVYNRSDKHSSFSEADTDYLRVLEAGLLREADHVLYVSRALMAAEHEITGPRAVFLDHGVDLELFQRGGSHADVEAIPSPRIGFVGTLRRTVVDLDLLERIAREIPGASLVLIGNADDCPRSLVELDNVYLLGPRPHGEVPALASGLDVALMPWKQNEWIHHCNPIKLKEYLALGLTVVSMPFAEIDRFRDVVSVAEDPDDFVARVESALRDGGVADRDQRRARVLSSSWDSKAQLVLDLCRMREAG